MKRLSFLFLLVFSTPLFSQPAMLDSTFGNNGVVITNIASADYISSVVIQSDGNIVAVGTILNGTNRDFAVVRYLSDGSLDTTFNGNGITTFGFDSLSNDQANGVALQSDGKIIIAGISFDSQQKFAIARLNTDGSLDTTFSHDGKQITSFGIQSDLATTVAIQPDGKIVVAGASGILQFYSFALARYLPDGTLDSTFSNDGLQVVPLSSSENIIYSMVLQPDGKIVVAGYAYQSLKYIAVARFLPDGILDSSFNSIGYALTLLPFLNDGDRAWSVLLQTDGKIVVAGTHDRYSLGLAAAVVRYLPDGSLDSTFNSDGKASYGLSGLVDLEIRSVLLQPNGKILLAGYDTTMSLIRFNSDGSVDQTLSPITIVYSPDIGPCEGLTAAMQTDGKIIIAGTIFNGNNNEFALARYVTDVTLGSNEFNINNDFIIYPNPVHDKAILKIINAEQLIVVFSLCDLTGRKVYEQIIKGNEFVLEGGMLNAGLYIWTLEENTGKIIGVGKVVLD